MSPPQPHQKRAWKSEQKDGGKDQLRVEEEDCTEAVEEDEGGKRLVQQPDREAGENIPEV